MKKSKEISFTILVIFLIFLTLFFGSVIAFKENFIRKNAQNKQEVITLSESDAQICGRLYKHKGISAADSREVKSLINDLNYIGFSFSDCAMSEDESFLNVYYETDTRSKYRFMNDYKKNFTQTAVMMFALVDDLSKVRFSVSDDYGEFYNFVVDKNVLFDDMQTKEFTDIHLKNAVKSKESFEKFFDEVSDIYYPINSNASERKIYSVLNKNSELVEGSKTVLNKTISQNQAKSLEKYIENAGRLSDKECEVIFYSANNYTDNSLYYYVFFFRNNTIIAFAQLTDGYEKDEIISLLN